MADSLAAFTSKLKALGKSIPDEAVAKKMVSLGGRAVDGVVSRSPVGNPSLWKGPARPGYVGGTFKNSWYVSLGSIAPGGARRPDASGSASLAEKSKIEAVKSQPYTIVYVHNSLPYAYRLEHGWSSQAPAGMVTLTLQSLATFSD